MQIRQNSPLLSTFRGDCDRRDTRASINLSTCHVGGPGARVTSRTITDLTIYLLILIATLIDIVVWVFGRKRKERFEKDVQIPFEDGKG
jgi:cytochrome c oxidase cbb3-type subunit IV